MPVWWLTIPSAIFIILASYALYGKAVLLWVLIVIKRGLRQTVTFLFFVTLFLSVKLTPDHRAIITRKQYPNLEAPWKRLWDLLFCLDKFRQSISRRKIYTGTLAAHFIFYAQDFWIPFVRRIWLVCYTNSWNVGIGSPAKLREFQYHVCIISSVYSTLVQHLGIESTLPSCTYPRWAWCYHPRYRDWERRTWPSENP